jgi:hypothetical protein
MMSFTDKVYTHLPTPLQHAAVSAFGLRWKRKRFGGVFERELTGFIERERFDAAEWLAWQTRMLREFLRIAVTSVPYYQEAWSHLSLTEHRIAGFHLEDLPELPILEKDVVQAQPEAFLIGGHPPRGVTICEKCRVRGLVNVATP